MKPVDFVRALGVAILVMALDLACAFAWVGIWKQIHQHGSPIILDNALLTALSTQSTRICGPILFALFVWLFSRRRPDRNAWLFALAVFAFYMLVDWGMVAFKGILEPGVLGIATLKLLGALAGAWLARFRPARKSV